jgi:hypothetical protein
LLAYCSNCKAMLTAVDGAVELVVDRPYKAGESIVVWYNISVYWLQFQVFFRSFLGKEDLSFRLFCGSSIFLLKYKACNLFCRCGPQPNSKLLINYGFVDEDNSYDRLVVEVKSLFFFFSFFLTLAILPFPSQSY